MSRPTVGLALIAKNEAENVDRLFRSVDGCFDEIRLTDTGSTDETVAIAERLGMKVHHFPWVHDFSAARNASFEPMTTDYVMWMDLDDVLENPEGFKNWRDTAMGLADYWIATYHYTSDPQGKPVCSFARERCFRRDKNLRWKYFVHEGITPDANTGPLRMQLTQAWAIRHLRTDQDLQKDRSRNLSLFESHTGNLDARMLYYYGKELFEAGKPEASIEKFSMALSQPELEVHDRILGMQYGCYAYIQLNQFEKAMQLAQQALFLSPHRAEFYGIIGDCYLKLNRWLDALPSFQAAKACHSPKQQLNPIFHAEAAYGPYPSNQIARIYAQMGDLDRAEAEMRAAQEKYPNPESDAILGEVVRLKQKSTGYLEATPCPDIVISCPPVNAYEFDPGVAALKSMGGSETALIEMAKHLKAISGRPVKVFNMRTEDRMFDGVEYISATKLMDYMGMYKPYLHIAWRHTVKVTNAPTFIWSHDLQTPGVEQTQNYDKVLCLTPFHKRYMMATQGVPEEKIHVTRNGMIPERFKDGPWEKDPFRFVFGSSPDRGLERCIRVLDRVREKYPEITLHVHYGWDAFYKTGNPHLIEMADKLQKMVNERKWIFYHGATQQDELMKSYKASAYVVQPSDFIETFCLSALEFLCCGVYPIFRKIGGVSDTLSEASKLGMATLVDSDCISELEYQKYIDATLDAIENRKFERVQVDPSMMGWDLVAIEWLKDLPKLVNEKV